MTDKKIVDDYYSQNQEVSATTDVNEKKPKFSIKWKIKIKKETEVEIKETSKIGKEDSESQKSQKVKQFKAPLERKEPIVDSKETTLWTKKEYFTKKWLEQKNEFVKKEFVKKDNKEFIKKEHFKKDDKTNNTQEKKGWFNKTWWYSTNLQPKQEWFKVQEWFKENKFQVKSKKPFDKNQEETNKKLFKKDKSNKYSKNIILDEDDWTFSRSNKIKNVKKEEKKVEDIVQNLTDRTWETVVIPDILSVKELSEKIWVPLMKLITEFMKNGMKVTINSKVDYDTAAIVSEAFQIKLQKDISAWFWVEDVLTWDISALLSEDDKSVLVPRAPVISIMWHVDHGKTSLLDYLRKTKVALKEAGWITQSIWAYQVDYNWQKITFLDTPGHEAFTIMRARWAKSTDIAILVVAADEWVKPQTIESINHAREAWLQIVVAITKIDKEWANLDNVKSWLSSNGLLCEDWWGDIPMVWVSSKTWAWIDELLEIILLVAEMSQLKANPSRAAVWTILESHLDMKLWPVSTVLINTWTLKKWDSIVCKWSYWKVKVMKNDLWKNIEEAWPSVPVLVVWLDSVCEWWDIVQVVSDIEKARLKALEYKELMASKKAAASSSIDLIMSKIKSWNLKQLKVVLKSDTNWSLEAVKWALLKLSTDETKVTIIHSWVWNITEWDVLMCQWSSALLIWFNVELLGNTKNIIEDTKIEYISSKVIYHITERVEKIITWMLDPKEIETILWEAEVWWIFFEWEGFMILWLKIKANNKIEKLANVRIIRKDKSMWNGKIENLKSWIIDVNDLEWPIECWIKLKTDVKIEMWDLLEIYKIEISK